MQVLNPTMTTLNVRWEPAEGRVKEYRLIYGPAAGGDRNTVGHTYFCLEDERSGVRTHKVYIEKL